MTTTRSSNIPPNVADVIQRYGKCLELVPTDPHFQAISVGLYVEGLICTVWSFSSKPGTVERLEAIRGQMVNLGELEPVPGSYNQVTIPCGHLHPRLLKFLLTQSVNKLPGNTLESDGMSINDTKSELTLSVSGSPAKDRWVYQVSGDGEARNPALRLRAVVAGFVRYGEMEKVGDNEVSFPCGQRHDGFMRILLPYSRNVSAVESMIEEEALRGQMTTGTLGFSQT